jgi:hypothetical protein
MTLPKQIPLPGAPEYQPYEVPEAVEAPQNTAPPPVQIQDTSLPAPKYGFGRGASGALGTAAFLATNVLRGYAQGKAISQARQAMNAKRVADGLHSVYEMAAKNYYQLYESRIDAGKKPTDPDFMTQDLQVAKDRVDVSWAAMMKYISGQVMGPAGQKKKKGKGKDQSGQADQTDPSVNPIAGLQSQDPVDRAKAWLAMATKIGPDVYIQTRALSSRQGMAEVSYGAQHAENMAQVESAKKELNDLRLKDRSNMSPEDVRKDDARIAQLQPIVASGGAQTGTKYTAPRFGPTVTGEDLTKMYPDGAPGPNGNFTPEKGSAYKEVIYGEEAGRPLVRYEPMTIAGQLKTTAGPTGEPVQRVFNPYTKTWEEGEVGKVAQKGQWIKIKTRDDKGNEVDAVVPYMPQYKHLYIPPPDGFKTDRPIDVGAEGTVKSGAQIVNGEDLQMPTPVTSGVTGPRPSTQTALTLATKGYPLIGGKEPEGLLSPGIIDLNNRKILRNADGSISTELSFSREINGQEVLVPQVVDGKKLSQDEAWQHYLQTGEHLGVFDTPEHADAYAKEIHNRQDQTYNKPKPSAGTPKAAASEPAPEHAITKAEQAAKDMGLPPGSTAYPAYSKDLAARANSIGTQELTINGKPGSDVDIGLRKALDKVFASPQDVENLGVAMKALDNFTKTQATGVGGDNYGWIKYAEDNWNSIPAVQKAQSNLTPAGKAFLPMFFRAWTNAALIRSLGGLAGKPTMTMQAMLANELPMPGVNVNNAKEAEVYITALQDDVDYAKSRLPDDMQDQLNKQFPRTPSTTSAPAAAQRPPGDSEDPNKIIQRLIQRHGPGATGQSVPAGPAVQ